jgi:hypothetical protein
MKRIYWIIGIPLLAIFAGQLVGISPFHKQVLTMVIILISAVIMLYKTIMSKENSITRLISAIFSLTIFVCLYFWIEQSSILEFIF